MNELPDQANEKLTSDDVQPVPSGDNGIQVRCSRCRADVPAGDQCPACGTFLPRNEANLRHGLRRYQTTGVLPEDLKITVEDFRQALISDQGGLEALSAVKAGLLRLLVDAEIGRRLLMSEVVKRGIDSKPGKSAYDRLLGTWDRWTRIAGMLGIDRQARQVNAQERLIVAFASKADREGRTS